MGVDENIIDFKQTIVPMSDDRIKQVIDTVSVDVFREFLQKSVFVNEYQDVEQLDTSNRNNILDYIIRKSKEDPPLHFAYNVVFYNINELLMEVETNNDGMLLFRDGYNKSWKGYVDGKEVPIYKVNIGFKGIPLKAGVHEIVFKYKPKLFLFAFYSFIILSFTFPVFVLLSTRKLSCGVDPI
jgi:hypothetical protein